MKYKVKNCPVIYSEDKCYSVKIPHFNCKDCTDCLIKQVIEKCKNDCVDFGGKELRYDTLDDILQLFEIEECKE